jgi:hypothetical protein
LHKDVELLLHILEGAAEFTVSIRRLVEDGESRADNPAIDPAVEKRCL